MLTTNSAVMQRAFDAVQQLGRITRSRTKPHPSRMGRMGRTGCQRTAGELVWRHTKDTEYIRRPYENELRLSGSKLATGKLTGGCRTRIVLTEGVIMNVIWIVSDTFRRDHLGAYGNSSIRTPSLDALAASAVRFDNHYSAGFPTMPTRADHQTGRWTMSFMGWEPLPPGATTLAEILAGQGMHTAASVDTPYYLRGGMNYDRGFQSFFMNTGQDTLWSLIPEPGYHNEALDVRAAWRSEADRNAPKTFMSAMRWLEQHYKEDFFLYVDTWDPHEPWDAPAYYTELYWPGYDGELVLPVYGNWHDVPGYREEQLRKGHATYCGEITMVDTWAGFLLRMVENMGLAEKTVVIFTTDHGFYFGEHGGLFGKMSSDKYPDGTLRPYDEPGSQWSYSPLYEEIVHLPLLIRAPGVPAGSYAGMSSAVDVMPTVLDLLGVDIPDFVQGRSLAPALYDPKAQGRDFVVSSLPFANVGDPVHSVDSLLRVLTEPPVTTVTSGGWSMLYSPLPGVSKLYNLTADPRQLDNAIERHTDMASELHAKLVRFMRETNVPERLLTPRLELRM